MFGLRKVTLRSPGWADRKLSAVRRFWLSSAGRSERGGRSRQRAMASRQSARMAPRWWAATVPLSARTIVAKEVDHADRRGSRSRRASRLLGQHGRAETAAESTVARSAAVRSMVAKDLREC